MRVDVSEVKSVKTCARQWQLSSRNAFHLTTRVTPPQFSLGTLFHEALHQLYLGVHIDNVMDWVRKEMSSEKDAALLAMIPGYARTALPGDLDRYEILDIEHKFAFTPTDTYGNTVSGLEDVEICGSIDMIVLDTLENKIYGFEHKTAKSFRDPAYIWMDEQPRVYFMALQRYVNAYNQALQDQWADDCSKIDANDTSGRGGSIYPERPIVVGLGGIYINEVKKLLRDFQYVRTLCNYSSEDIQNFSMVFFEDVRMCKHHRNNSNALIRPKPGFFDCQMCTFKTICSTYMYESLNKERIIEDFAEEFKEREEDHLDEKVERKVEK